MISAAQSLKENRVAIVTAGSDMGFFIQNFYYMLRLVQKKHIHYVPPVSQTEKIR